MAFTGTIATTQVGKDVIRITGLSLLAGANGTFTDFGGAGDEVLPTGFMALSGNEAKLLIWVNQIAAGATSPIIWENATGTLTITNTDAGNATGELVITLTIPQTRIA